MHVNGSWYRMKWDDENPEDFADLGYGSLEPGKSDNPARNFFVPAYLAYSDYSGSSVEQANFRVFRDEFGSIPGVYELRGDYGSRGFAIAESLLERACECAGGWNAGDTLTLRAHTSEPGKGLSYPAGTVVAAEDGRTGGWDVYDAEDGSSFYGFSVEFVDGASPIGVRPSECECDARHAYAIREFLEKLDDYPVASDDELSRVEMELEQEAWNSYGRHDFTRELRRIASDYGEAAAEAVDDAEADTLDTLYRTLAERANVYPTHESGGSVVFWEERAAEAVTLDELRTVCGAALVEVRKLRVRGTLPGNVEAAEYVAERGGSLVRDEDDEDCAPIVVVAASEADAVAYFSSL